jgi:hypothetical protein
MKKYSQLILFISCITCWLLALIVYHDSYIGIGLAFGGVIHWGIGFYRAVKNNQAKNEVNKNGNTISNNSK